MGQAREACEAGGSLVVGGNAVCKARRGSTRSGEMGGGRDGTGENSTLQRRSRGGKAGTRSPGKRSWRAWGTTKELVTKQVSTDRV